jgi:hypothetical protein
VERRPRPSADDVADVSDITRIQNLHARHARRAGLLRQLQTRCGCFHCRQTASISTGTCPSIRPATTITTWRYRLGCQFGAVPPFSDVMRGRDPRGWCRRPVAWVG